MTTPGMPWCCSNGRTAPATCCRPTGSTSRSRSSPQRGRTSAMRELTGYGTFVPRLERLVAIRQFLADEGLGDAPRDICRAMPRRAPMSGSRMRGASSC